MDKNNRVTTGTLGPHQMVTKSKRMGVGRPKADRSGYEPVPSSTKARQALAVRARDRRKHLGLSADEVASSLGVARSTLVQWETSMPAHLLPKQAIRWENVLNAPRGWLTNAQMEAPAADAESLRAALARRAKKRREEIWLTQKYLTEPLGINLTTFQRWERVLPRRLSPEQQRNWEAVLQVPRGWLYDQSMKVTPAGKGRGVELPSPVLSGTYRKFPESVSVRRGLAFRAAERRTIIGLSVREIGAIVGIRPGTLSNYEEEMPRQILEEQAARWEGAIEAPRGWLNDLSMPADPPVALQSDWPEFDTVFDAIQGVASWLSRPKLRERSFHYSDLNEEERRRVSILLRRYGIPTGRPGVEVAAAEFGTSKHEVSQITNAMASRAQGLDGKRLDPLDEIPQLIEPLLPSHTDVLETKLAGVLGGVSVRNADLFCRSLLGRSFFRDRKKPLDMPGPGAEKKGRSVESLVRSLTARLMRGTGAVQTHTLYGLVADTTTEPIPAKEVLRVAAALPGFVWLDATTGWFLVEPYTISLINTVAIKILSACGTGVETKDVTQGIARSDWRVSDDNAVFHSFTPPESVVAAVLRRLPDIRINQKLWIESRAPISPNDCLSGSEMAVLRCVQAHAGIASWSQLKSDLVDGAVVSLPALNLVLTNSPIVRKIDNALYSIRGLRFSGKALDQALAFTAR